MNPLSNDNIPEICSEVGLTCDSCTAGTARHLAAICKALPGKMVAQLFVQIYPSSACAPMHRSFAAQYREASAAFAETLVETLVETMDALVERPPTQRREMGFARPRIMTAVA